MNGKETCCKNRPDINAGAIGKKLFCSLICSGTVKFLYRGFVIYKCYHILSILGYLLVTNQNQISVVDHCLPDYPDYLNN